MKTKVKLVVAFAVFAMLGNINAEETTQNTNNTQPTTQKSNGGGAIIMRGMTHTKSA
ncbi:hypothetical protein [Helicobacter sp. T3_23-1056]